MSERGSFVRALESEIVFESYGVRVKILAPGRELLGLAEETARRALVNRLTILENVDSEHCFEIREDNDGTLHLLLNGEHVTYDDTSKARFFKFFNSFLRIVVAEHATNMVFVHAGVVAWKGKAIVMPADSFRGKTTLVAELVKNGAEYYSDEYAVFDENGLVHPFPRALSIRDERNSEKDIPAEDLGGTVGVKSIPVGLVVLTEYEKDSEWNPEKLSLGQGIMEMIPHTIPRNYNTQLSLKVLNTAVSDAIILKSRRGEAAEFALKLLSFFDNITNLAKMT